MRILSNIQLKALLLLTVFSLSTIAGFACSIGVNMGYNKDHHGSTPSQHEHNASQKADHPHESHDADHHTDSSETDCCADGVIQISQTDKRTTTIETSLQPPVFLLTYLSFIQYCLPSVNTDDEVKNYKYLQRKRFSFPDICIAVQSFLI